MNLNELNAKRKFKYPPTKKQIGERIKEMRLARQWKQIDAAGMLGVSQNCYAKWELGNTSLTVERLFELADLYNVPVANFLAY